MDDFHCSFCGKRQREVRKLITGPRVFICNGCVALCRDLLGKAPAAPEPAGEEPTPEDWFEKLPQADAIRHRERQGVIDAATAQAQLSDLFGAPFTDLDRLEIDEAVLRLIPLAVARRHHLVPVALSGRRLTIAMSIPQPAAVAEARNATHLDVEVTLAHERAVFRKLDRHYPRPPASPPDSAAR